MLNGIQYFIRQIYYNLILISLDYGDENVEQATADLKSFKNFLDRKQSQNDQYKLFEILE